MSPPATTASVADRARPAVAAPPEPAGPDGSGAGVRSDPSPAAFPALPGWVLPIGALVGGPVLWWLGFRTLDPRALGAIGPVGVLPAWAYLGPALLMVSFAVMVAAPRLREGWAAAHVVVLAATLHGVPALVYGTLRYSWAWKHVGIVEFIDRTGGIDRTIDVQPVYHNWPGFFAGAKGLADLAGTDALVLARWAPPVFAILTALAVVFVVGALSPDRRVVWTSAWLAVLGNWVGQEYFSPQAVAFVGYLVAVGLALRLGGERPWTGVVGLWTTALILTITAAVAVSHPLTPLLLVVSLVGLAVVTPRLWPQAATIGVVCLGWVLWGASAYVGESLGEELRGIGRLADNAEDNLVDLQQVSDGQALVSLVGRGAVLVLVGLALTGGWRWWRAGERRLQGPVLLTAPLVLLVLSGYGGEILFRVLLFAVPLLAFFAAWALVPGRTPVGRGVGVAVAGAVLFAGFLFAHHGKDDQYVFSPGEVAAARSVYANAPEGSLLLEGTRNYPLQFRNYERFRYVPLASEPISVRRRLHRQPAAVLQRWMTGGDETEAYLIITRSQKAEMEALGIPPRGLLDRIERVLSASPAFRVAYRDPDAVVFVPADQP